MDAPAPIYRPLIHRICVAWLAGLVALGLWQGYAKWLLSGGVAHVT
jgi:hypothetical protein